MAEDFTVIESGGLDNDVEAYLRAAVRESDEAFTGSACSRCGQPVGDTTVAVTDPFVGKSCVYHPACLGLQIGREKAVPKSEGREGDDDPNDEKEGAETTS